MKLKDSFDPALVSPEASLSYYMMWEFRLSDITSVDPAPVCPQVSLSYYMMCEFCLSDVTSVDPAPVCPQVCLSYYMMREFWLSRPATQLCYPIEVTDTDHSLRLAHTCWLFHISKLVDFLDTVFLVLKKDNKRMTYLHVYHHGSMAFGFWLCTLFAPGETSQAFGFWLCTLFAPGETSQAFGFWLCTLFAPGETRARLSTVTSAAVFMRLTSVHEYLNK